MLSLFPVEPNGPEGFSYFPSFITREEEETLVHAIESTELHAMQFRGYEAKRKVASFGYDWNFETRVLTQGKIIPGTFQWLMQKLATQLQLTPEAFGELLLTEYPVGSVINWHRDAPPFDIIAGISLLSDCTFRFRPHEKSKQGRKSIITFPLERRSIYVMQGPARSEWEHSIPAVKNKRFSITVRTLRANA